MNKTLHWTNIGLSTFLFSTCLIVISSVWQASWQYELGPSIAFTATGAALSDNSNKLWAKPLRLSKC